MSELRDARFNKALEAAPDAHMRPDAAIRAAIRRSAMAAITSPVAAHAAAAPAPKPWWRMPWNAALASVVLASLVTVMWRNEDIPGAAPEQGDRPIPAAAAPAAPPPVARAPVQVPAPTSAPAQAPAPAPPKPSAGTAERQADALRQREAAATRKAAQEPAPARQAEMAAKSAPPAAEAPAPSTALRDQAPPRAESRSQAAGAAVARTPAPAHAPAPMQAPAAPALQVDQAQAGTLPELLRRAIASPPADAPFAEPGARRIELLQAGKLVGVLELGETLLRWTPEPDGSARVLRPEAPLLKALRDELARPNQNR